jgi:hypothetical protein
VEVSSFLGNRRLFINMPDRPSLKTTMLDTYSKSTTKSKVDNSNFYGFNSNYDTISRSHRYTDVSFSGTPVASRKPTSPVIATLRGPSAPPTNPPILSLVVYRNNQNVFSNDQQICDLDYYQ